MVGIEYKEILTVELLNDLFDDLVSSKQSQQFKRSLRLLGFQSIGHFILLALDDIFKIEEDPSIIKAGKFGTYLESKEREIPRFKLWAIYKFSLGVSLFDKFSTHVITEFVRNYSAEFPGDKGRIALKQMIVFQGNIELTEGKHKINDQLLRIGNRASLLDKMRKEVEVDFQKNEFKKSLDYLETESKYYKFNTNLQEFQIDKLVHKLSEYNPKHISSKAKGGFYFMFGYRDFTYEEFEFPIRWERKASELVYLFVFLIELNLIPKSELTKLHIHLSLNFIDSKGAIFNEKSLKKAMERTAKVSQTIYQIGEKNHKAIYDLVRDVANMG